MAGQAATIVLRSGAAIPRFGVGTWRMGERRERRSHELAALRLAVELGISLIDTAEMYGDVEFRTGSGVQLEHWVGAFGNGGQRLFVFPGLELIVVTTFNNFTPDQWMPPVRVLREAVLPSLV